jgi:hypothetical protein
MHVEKWRRRSHLKFSPPSEHSKSRCSGRDSTNSLRCACSKAFHTSVSVYCSYGSRFNRKDPEKRTGSCNFRNINLFEDMEESYLGYDSQPGSKVMKANGGNVEVVNYNRSISRLNQSEQCKSKGGFTSPSSTHYSNLSTNDHNTCIK